MSASGFFVLSVVYGVEGGYLSRLEVSLASGFACCLSTASRKKSLAPVSGVRSSIEVGTVFSRDGKVSQSLYTIRISGNIKYERYHGTCCKRAADS